MPIINLLALGVPIAILLWAGTRRLTPGSAQRKWSIFGIGITTTPLLIILLEFFFMITGFFVVAFVLSLFFQDTVTNINELLFAITGMANSQEIPVVQVAELLREPIILTIILLFVSVLIPVLEELIKPAAMLLLWEQQRAEAGPHTVKSLGERLHLDSGTLTPMLKRMEQAGLITGRKASRNVFYAVDAAGMGQVIGYLLNDCCRSHPEVCACCTPRLPPENGRT